MRHRVYGKHLGRNRDERDTLFKGLVQALLTHGSIQTSEAKAKAIKGLVDKVVNLAKDKRTERQLQSIITDKNLRDRLTEEIIPKLDTRTSGYSKMVRMGRRSGDQTMMVKLSLIGAEELKPIEKGYRVPARGEARQRRQGTGVSKKAVATEANKKEKKTIKIAKKAVRVKSKISKHK